MSTSIHSGLVQFGTTLHGTDDDPVDSVVARDGVANGLLHSADSYAQVRVNVVFPDTSTFSAAAAEFGHVVDTSPVVDQWYPLGGGPFGEWPLTIHANGSPYKLRIRVGLSANSSSISTQTVRVVVCPTSIAVAERDRAADHVYELTFGSGVVGTTPTWVAGQSRGTVASATMLTISAENAAAWVRSVNVYDAVSAATPRSVQQCMVSAHVFTKSPSTTIYARLHALHIAEYVGT